ncbi:MAG: GEVED domain-containing protein [Aquaticitalea sp.]
MNFKTTLKEVYTSLYASSNRINKSDFSNNYWIFIFGLTFLFQIQAVAQTETITSTGSGTFIVPCDVTSITVQAWGGGGAGGGDTSNNIKGGGGGAGGTYVSSVIAVTPGQSVNYFVGSGGNGDYNSGDSGTASWFNTIGTLYAQGGAGGSEPNGGTVAGGVGSIASSIGATRIPGTNGANGTSTIGGAGGNGGNSGGAGGAQRTAGNGYNGSSPGGGGGGAFVNNNSNRIGGNGGDGQIRLTYTSTLNIYCEPSFNSAILPITNVTFAGINNTTSNTYNGSADIEYFCQTATVVSGSPTNAISVKGNTYGYNRFYVRAYIDWDKNGTYGNNGNEIYDLGSFINSSGIDAVTLSSNIDVPASALVGNTKMRIMYRYGSYSNDACETGNGYGQAEEYMVRITAPQPPTITSFPSSTCSGASLVITGTNLSTATSVTVGGTPAAITASTANSVTVTIGNGTTGVISVTTAGGTATSSSAITVTVCYCEASVTNGRQDDNYINNVRFVGTLDDVSNLNSGYSNTTRGYQDFTGLSNRSIQAQGEGINVFIEGPNIAMIRAWVDWNNDGTFNTTGAEAVYTSGNVAAYSTTFGFVIPANQTPGLYRIRLRTNSSGGSSSIDPCGNINNGGETEDYLFQVVASCSANIVSLTNGESCGAPANGNASVNLSVTGTTGTTEIRWYNSFTGGTLVQTTPVSSGTTAFWSPSIPTTTLYYVTAFNGSCESQVRKRITATIRPVSNITYSPTNPESCGENSIVTLTASGDNELITLIDEDFEEADLNGLGVFTGQTLGTNNTQANWRRRESTFIPSQQVWFPAISSGLGTNKFAMATSDVGGSGYDNALLSPIVNTTNFINLTLTFRMYYSDYYSSSALDNVSIEVSTNGGTSWTSAITYNSTVGIGTRFSDISINVPATYLNRTNLRFRFRYTSGWADGVAIDDIKIFGERPLAPSFDWGATPVDAYQDYACTIPYASGTTIGTVYVKPTLAQLELGTFNFTATATLNNGCTTSQPITITNKSRVWKGTVNQNWNNPNNWLPRGVPTIDNCVIIPEDVKIPTNATNPASGYEAFAKNLTIKSSGSLEIHPENNLTVKEWIHNNGSDNFHIRNKASLIQIDDILNIGEVIMDRTASVKKTDYIYYSSPVDGFSMTNLSPLTPNSVKFSWQPTTTAGNGFVYGNWDNAGTAIMGAGTGYIVRGPTGWNTPQALTATFEGRPRNGNMSVPINRGNYTGANTTHQGRLVTKDDDNYNLIGNPYPSAISADAFLSNAQNSNILGSIYLWPHGGLVSTANPDPFYQDFVYNYNSDDYITYNAMGSVPANAFNGFVAAGQSFFVLMTDAGSLSENVHFNNAMRVSKNNAQFLRTTVSNADSDEETEAIELHRIYLDMVLPNGKTNSTLIGYTPTATNEFDRLFDTPILDNTTQSIYSKIADNAMIIQGREAPLNPADHVPLGVLITQQGIHTIALNSVDGVFSNEEQHIYLEDLETGIIHNLKNSPYTFSASNGRYEERFILKYTNEGILGTQDFQNNSDVRIISFDKTIKVTSEKQIIENIVVYDVSGRVIFEYKKLNSNEFKIPLNNISHGTLIVKAKLQNGKEKTKAVVY